MKKYTLLFIFFLFSIQFILAQSQDSTRVLSSKKVVLDSINTKKDTTIAKKDTILIKKSDYPNPKKALLYSLIPGGGQVYNKKYWKIPLVYGAFAGVGYMIVYNESLYKKYRDNYYAKVNNLKTPNDFPTATTAALKTARDFTNKNRQLSYVGAFAVYLLSAADAYVDAHLKTFDVGDDLSLKIKIPTQTTDGLSSSYVGFGIVLNW